MKKIVYIFLLALAIVFISSRTQSRNSIAENIAKPTELNETKAAPKSSTDSPRIHYLLHKSTGKENLSPALWWSYKPTSMDGC